MNFMHEVIKQILTHGKRFLSGNMDPYLYNKLEEIGLKEKEYLEIIECEEVVFKKDRLIFLLIINNVTKSLEWNEANLPWVKITIQYNGAKWGAEYGHSYSPYYNKFK